MNNIGNQSPSLMGLSIDSVTRELTEMGEKPFRAKQIMRWLYGRLENDPKAMTDLPEGLRDRLESRFETVVFDEPRSDPSGVMAWPVRLADQQLVECVAIPSANRVTLCVSSQAGCVLDCAFCATGRQGFSRHLTPSEIVGQLWRASLNSSQRISNVVFMGMGEPLLNCDAVFEAARVMMDDRGFGLSKRRVTISTAGVVPGIERMAREVDCALTLSLHAADDATRAEIMPIAKRWTLKDVFSACQYWVESGQQERILTIAWTLLRDVNDHPSQARDLARMLRYQPFGCKVNVLPFHGFKDSGFEPSSHEATREFVDTLANHGVRVTWRSSRGESIEAACGLLRGRIGSKSRRGQRIGAIEIVS